MAQGILVATDGSDTGNRAVDFAAELSKKLGRDLIITHVHLHGRPPSELMRLTDAEHLIKHIPAKDADRTGSVRDVFDNLFASSEKELERARAIVAIGEQVLIWAKQRAEDAGAQKVRTFICAGDYADEILEIADAEDAGMIVLGSRGLGPVRELLLGSVSQKVLHHANCTVVIVR